MMCRRLKVSLSELKQMPEGHVELWKAIFEGEDQARRQAAASAGG